MISWCNIFSRLYVMTLHVETVIEGRDVSIDMSVSQAHWAEEAVVVVVRWAETLAGEETDLTHMADLGKSYNIYG